MKTSSFEEEWETEVVQIILKRSVSLTDDNKIMTMKKQKLGNNIWKALK